MTCTPPVTLHLGAHRTATTSLQGMLAARCDHLAARGIAVWGPGRTRDGLLAGIAGDPGRSGGQRDVRAYRSAGRIAMLRDGLEHDGISRLILSDANLLGSLRENVLLGRLYPSVSGRAERLNSALPGVDRIVLTVRNPETWWISVFAAMIGRGFPPPDRAMIDAVAKSRRSWRDVITDLAEAFPTARLSITTYEEAAARPQYAFRSLTGEAPATPIAPRMAASPDARMLIDRLRAEGWTGDLPVEHGRYAPFDPEQRAMLRARYDDDLTWLRRGAGGLVATDDAPHPGPYRDRRSGHDTIRRESQLGAAG
ncbi:hypothetical protein MWU52_06925 [Jannaschia sp. S6380]|uniref:hypothetical protein n=1 Tax=Jannaschia sp. S6380 TaxID=2926408 RepID=UPI001FF24A3A|nr:hypothetical protein [Jannaschia sp. S6380]MCK0167278.1 hypothetical protein [Jannaschia sp. S6380]